MSGWELTRPTSAPGLNVCDFQDGDESRETEEQTNACQTKA